MSSHEGILEPSGSVYLLSLVFTSRLFDLTDLSMICIKLYLCVFLSPFNLIVKNGSL